MGAPSRIGDHLYLFEDTCLVYLLVDGERGLLVDCGSGAILDQLEPLGVRCIEWVLHTHHHRDQCQGARRLVEHGASLAVPEREAHLFAEVERFWSARQHAHRYDLGSDWFTLRESVPVAATLADYDTFRWRSYGFRILPAPGHTRGSIALVAGVDGQTVAFTGDLIASPGRLWQVASLQWTYGGGVGVLDGVQPAVHALAALRAASPDRLLPSHGQVMESPDGAIDETLSALRSLVRFQEADANDATLIPRPVGLVTDRRLVQISDHLWMSQFAFANSYVLISDSGAGLFVDYGYPTFHHFLGGFRFAEHAIRELTARAGLARVEVVIPTHFHDDHVGGIPYLRRTFGTQVWAHEVMVDVLERPDSYNLPCLLPEPIHVDRALRDGERFAWHEFQLCIAHTPGHTRYHAALFLEVDGLRVAVTGDILHSGIAGPILGGPIFQNRFSVSDFESSLEGLRAWAPELLLTGHTGVAEVDGAWFDILLRRAREAGERFRALVGEPDEADFALDPSWARIHPYQQTARPGQEVELAVRLYNHGRDAVALVALAAPAGWAVDPRRVAIELPGHTEREARFMLRSPAGWAASGPAVVCADVSLDEGRAVRRYGEIAEGLLHMGVQTEPDHTPPEEHEDVAESFLRQADVPAGRGPVTP